MRVGAHARASRPAEELVNWNTKRFAFNVPKRLIDATNRARQHWPTPIERVPIHGLPVMRDGARVFADEVRSEFLDGGCDGFGAAFDDGFTEPSNACIRMDLQEEPAWLDHKCFDFGDLEFVADADSCPGILASALALVLFELFQVI